MERGKRRRQREQATPDPIPEAVRAYEGRRPLQQLFTSRLSELIQNLLSSQNISVHAIEQRTKELESYREKLARPGKSYSDPLNQVTDLTGIRIIVYYFDDLERVARVLRDEMAIDSTNSYDTLEKLSPHEFGYRSIHFVLSIDHKRGSLSEWSQFKTLRAEVQVRTVLQHAWAAISHALQYKHEEDVPSESRRKLFRLAGLLELADEQFDELRKAHESIARRVAESLKHGDQELEVNAVSTAEYLRNSPHVKEIFDDALDAGFRTGPESDDPPEKYISQIAYICAINKVVDIREFDAILEASKKWRRRFFKAAIDRTIHDWYGDALFFVDLVLIGHFHRSLTPDILRANGWSSDAADLVLESAKAAVP